MGKLDGKVALISGGARGQGAAEVLVFSREGAKVVFGDVLDDEGRKVEAAVRGKGGDVAYLHLDVSSEADWQKAVQVAIDRYGRLDILINNAGIVIRRVPIEERTVEEWDRVMAVNLRGMFLACRAVFPAMKAQGRGKIVNISSSRVWEGTPNRLHYTTSKAGVIGFTRALAREVGEFGITVNAVTPGMTQSDTQVQSSSGNYLAARVAGRAIERVQLPADLVGAVMFLSSAASDFMTGQTLNVDGGKAMH